MCAAAGAEGFNEQGPAGAEQGSEALPAGWFGCHPSALNGIASSATFRGEDAAIGSAQVCGSTLPWCWC